MFSSFPHPSSQESPNSSAFVLEISRLCLPTLWISMSLVCPTEDNLDPLLGAGLFGWLEANIKNESKPVNHRENR